MRQVSGLHSVTEKMAIWSRVKDGSVPYSQRIARVSRNVRILKGLGPTTGLPHTQEEQKLGRTKGNLGYPEGRGTQRLVIAPQ